MFVMILFWVNIFSTILVFFQVRWDDEMDPNRQDRVSPWEIQPSSSFSGSNNLSIPGSKRAKMVLPLSNPDISVNCTSQNTKP